MSSHRLAGKVLDHQEATQLLPWLGTDRLAAEEVGPLLDHLKVCRDCRRELRDLAELGRFAELAERGEAPDAAAIEARLGGLLGRLPAAPGGRVVAPSRPTLAAAPASVAQVPPPGAVGWRQVLPLAALVLLAVGLLAITGDLPELRKPGESVAAPYKTLSSPEAAPPAGGALRVVVADGCTQGELRRLLNDAGAEIVGGPSRHGVYTIGLPPGAEAAAQIAAWRPLACFSFVERVAGSGASAPEAGAS